MTRINDRIRAPKIRVIDGVTNQQIGVMSSQEALVIARQRGLDLVEISADAKPPVCKIVEYGKWKYQQSKHKAKVKAQGGKVKEIKFRINIDPHDYGIKLAHAEEFLDHNNKIKIHLQFRGRQGAHPELGFQLMMRIKEDLKTMGHVDMEPRQAGRSISMMLSPLGQSLRQRKFAKPVTEYVESEEFDEEEEEDDDEEEHDEAGGETNESDHRQGEEERPASAGSDGHHPHHQTLSLAEILDQMESDGGKPKKKRKL
ncbi:MAG: translation initiation factor IF-3 [Verrucomicrobiales bacterium]|nr:translation initiation factor IF-3 [Verrucomicrobiales bacterium]